MRKHLARLDQIWIEQPVFFITACTSGRREELANQQMHDICVEVWRNSEHLYGWFVGRYVLMPDHVHFFCVTKGDNASLSSFIGKWKEWTAKYALRRHSIEPPLWQPEFFDHLLRDGESYEEKWKYMQLNPVRAGLVAAADEWPYEGELNAIRWE